MTTTLTASPRGRLVLAVSTGAALLIGMVGYGIYLMAGPPVSYWNPPLWLGVTLIASYAALTAAAWYGLLRRSLDRPVRAVFLVGAVVGTATLAVFVVFNILVVVLSFVLELML